MTQILKVVSTSEVMQVASQKAEGGLLSKREIVLQDGGKFGNQYVATLLGNAAQCQYTPGDLYAVELRFQAREYNGSYYQDITVNEITKI